MKYIRLMVVLLALLSACTMVSTYTNPDYSFAPTNPGSIRVYMDGLLPNYSYQVIGSIVIDATWTLDTKGGEKKVAKMAAQAGADGIIISSVDVDFIWLSNGIKIYGYTWANNFFIHAYQTGTGYRTIVIRGYLIKRQ